MTLSEVVGMIKKIATITLTFLVCTCVFYFSVSSASYDPNPNNPNSPYYKPPVYTPPAPNYYPDIRPISPQEPDHKTEKFYWGIQGDPFINGFEGIQWGTNIASVQDQFFSFSSLSVSSTSPKYSRIHDKLKQSNPNIKSITYFFPKGRLESVEIETFEYKTFDFVAMYLMKSYGISSSSSLSEGRYRSLSRTTDISARYDPTTKKALFQISSSNPKNGLF